MIKIKYECDETGQEMTVTMTLPKDNKDCCKLDIKFEPEIEEGTKDPAGVMGRIFEIFQM